MTHATLFLTLATVSKSLLTVLGTLAWPAVNGRGKCRLAGLERSRKAWTTPESGVAHTFHRPTATTTASPALLLDHLGNSMPQEVRPKSTHPACSAYSASRLAITGEPRRCPASHGAGPSGVGSRPVLPRLTQVRFPSQGWLTVVSLPPVSVSFSFFHVQP
jgi:hypothetical protein